MKLTGKIVGGSIDFSTGRPCVSFEINEGGDFRQMMDDMKDLPKISIEVKPYRPRRSLDANAYCWTLIDKLAEKLNLTKEEVYREYITHIGGNSQIVCVKNDSVDKLCSGWQQNGIGWQTDKFPSKLDGCTNVILYQGSSTYDSAQMSRLINLIVQDCKEQGIETDTPQEIERMMALWRE